MFQLPYVSVFYLCICVCANLVVLALFFPLLCVVLDILCIRGNKGILNLCVCVCVWGGGGGGGGVGGWRGGLVDNMALSARRTQASQMTIPPLTGGPQPWKTGLPRVREKLVKEKFIFSRSGNFQGIWRNVRGILEKGNCQGNVREFHVRILKSMLYHNFHKKNHLVLKL